jgi:non-lysosomal glucosylceramidase
MCTPEPPADRSSSPHTTALPSPSATAPWPVLRSYDAEHLSRIAMPIGGIGTGTVSLGGHGDPRDWEIGNRPAKGFRPDHGFFAIHVDGGDGHTVTRALESRLDHSDYEGPQGSAAANHGLPRFRHGDFHAAYPLGQVSLSDPDVPVSVLLRADTRPMNGD